MPLIEALGRTLSSPTTMHLWQLRAELLESGVPPGGRVWAILGEYQRFLEQVRASTESRQYSELASELDIASISGIVVERFLEPQGARELALSTISGILSEGLMALATRQHVKAWKAGLASVCAGSAWFLYEEMWHWAQRKKPEVNAVERRRLLDLLFAPACSAHQGDAGIFLLIGSLFQVLLVSEVADEIARLPAAQQAET
ncbi:MAG: hypothetical protein H6Q06_1353 [Acidobacteria bacterium]|nr:hypothetical protein [Acidobacteriota bacterium]